MEPLAPAVLKALTPTDIEVRFYDDRLEPIPYEERTDLVALSVETYTARRAYQIASEYRSRGIPVALGGFHPTLMPGESAEHADCVVEGEAEETWPALVEDFRAGRLKKSYQGRSRPSLSGLIPDRSIFEGKGYLPIGLVEWGRGCLFGCEFCSIHAFHERSYRHRPVKAVVDELRSLRRRLIFFVDDNLACDPDAARELLQAVKPLGIRWVGQASLHLARDEALLSLFKESGCQGLLIGFESLDSAGLGRMNKGFNRFPGGYEEAVRRFRRHGIRLYATFMLGYGGETEKTFEDTLDFAKRQKFYLAAFNHVIPFPGTQLFRRLEGEGRLRSGAWWLEPSYRFGQLPFEPEGMSAEDVSRRCLQARRAFYSIGSILRRSLDLRANNARPFSGLNYFAINWMMRREVEQRVGLALGERHV